MSACKGHVMHSTDTLDATNLCLLLLHNWGSSFISLHVRHAEGLLWLSWASTVTCLTMADAYRPIILMTVVPQRIMEKAVTTCQTCQVCFCTSLPNQPPRNSSVMPCAERKTLARTQNLQARRVPLGIWLTGNHSAALYMLWYLSSHPLSSAAAESGTDDSTSSESGSSSGEDESTGDSEDSQLAEYVEGILDEQEDIPEGFAPRAMEHLAMSPFHPM